MRANLKNISNNRVISVVDRRTGRLLQLNPAEEKQVVIESEEDLKTYRNSYGAFGLEVSLFIQPKEELPAEGQPAPVKEKEPELGDPKEELPVEEPKEELTVEEKPSKKSKSSKAKEEPKEEKLEEVPVESVEVEKLD